MAAYAVGQTVSVDEAEGAELVSAGLAYDTMAPIHRTSDLNPDIKHDTTKAGTAHWEANTGGLATSGQDIVQRLESNVGSQSTTGSAVPSESPPPSGSTVGEEALGSAAAPRDEGTTLSQSTDLGAANVDLEPGTPGDSGDSRKKERQS